MNTISRKEAKARGQTHYYTGKPCKYGHIGKRFVSTGQCHACTLEHRMAYHYRHHEKSLKNARAYKANNKNVVNAINAKRRSLSKCATPQWANQEMIKVVYEKAAKYGLQVDHIVPLTSNLVCGLHVWHNLQLLDESLNKTKRNKYWPDMPEEGVYDIHSEAA